jgi:hypothetical protein
MVTTEQYVGNYMTKSHGFIRVRRRNFYPSRFGAAGYDVVHAVRINGKPRHTFVLGLGSLRDKRPERGKYSLTDFWVGAIERMKRHGLDEQERRQLADAVTRKGVPLPSVEQCRWHKLAWLTMIEPLDEILGWLDA